MKFTFYPIFFVIALFSFGLVPGRADTGAEAAGPPLGLTLTMEDFPEGARREMQEAAASGRVGSVAIPLEWNRVEPSPGEFDWGAYDALVETAEQAGLEVVFILGPTAQWASKAPDYEDFDTRAAKMPKDWKAYRAYVGESLAHYRGRVKYWQIWRAFNFSRFRATRSKIPILVRHTWEAAKAADPSCRLILPDTGGVDLGWIYRLKNSITWGQFDILGLRPFASRPERLRLRLAVLQSEVMAGGAKPLWITGRGRRTCATDDVPRMQLEDDLYRVAREGGVERIFVPAGGSLPEVEAREPDVAALVPGKPLDRADALAQMPPLGEMPAVFMDLNHNPVEAGLYNSGYRGWPGGNAVDCEVGGMCALRTNSSDDPGLSDREAENPWFYFDVDDRFLYFTRGEVPVEVTIVCAGAREAGQAGFNIYYDAGARYRFSPWQWIEPGRGRWFTYKVVLPDAWLANKEGYDFRINTKGSREEVYISRVEVRPLLSEEGESPAEPVQGEASEEGDSAKAE